MKHFQSDRWQRKYPTPQERRENTRFIAFVILAIVVVAFVTYWVFTPGGGARPSMESSPKARR